jgi:hypothetical protein
MYCYLTIIRIRFGSRRNDLTVTSFICIVFRSDNP